MANIAWEGCMIRRSFLFAAVLILSAPVIAQDSEKHDNNFDVRSSVGDLHVGSDADAKKAGLPLYPGARPKHEKDGDPLNFKVLTETFGLKLVIAKYESDDAPAKVVAYYRQQLKKYGRVLECRTQKHDGDTQMDLSDHDSDNGKELKCDENSGPVTELKVGTEDNQHIVAVEPSDAGAGSTFALVYLYSRGKHGEI
jgi:hypothetical protein